MRDIQKQHNLNQILILLLSALFFILPAFAEDHAVTNDDIYKILGQSSGDFQKSHSVMSEQHLRLVTILASFLTGDTETINKESDEILKDMTRLIQTHPPIEENGSNVWQAVAKIAEETQLMKQDASKNDYSKAYGHFSNITASCIQCHQVAREWGKFPKPIAEETDDKDSLDQKPVSSMTNSQKNPEAPRPSK